MVQVRIVNKSKHTVPEYSTVFSAGMDLRANIDSDISLKPMERKLIATGIFIELPAGFEAQVRPRSGLSLKYGITVLNTPGTIDADYRGEISVILVNLSNEEFFIHDGDRIAQMIINEYTKVQWVEVEVLNFSDRGEGGFGHTGKI
jgi:dUTP pyrophosphatase